MRVINRLGQAPATSHVLALVGLAWMAATLLGWFVGLDVLVRPAPHRAATVPGTALGMLLLYAGVLLDPGRAERRSLIRGLAVTAALVASLSALLSAFGLTGLDAKLFSIWQTGDAMSAGTSVGLSVGALALILLAGPTRQVQRFAVILSVIGMSSMFAVLVGHNFDPASPYAIPICRAMSAYTAINLAMFFSAVLLSNLRHDNEF